MRCSCYSSVTGEEYAVKKISQTDYSKYKYLVQNEIEAGQAVALLETPRIPRLVAAFTSSDKEACLVME